MNNDLISRDALKTAIEDLYDDTLDGIVKFGIEKAIQLIDNAPTVEPEVKKVPIASVTFDTEKLKELTDEIVERIKSGEIVLQDERPQGEWIFVSRNCWKCPYCQELTNEGKNFCPNCGAKMKGGAE